MPLSNLSGKTKADLVVLAELSGLLTLTQARKMTKPELINFLQNAEQKSENVEQKPPVEQKSEKKEKAVREKKTTTVKTSTAKSSAAKSSTSKPSVKAKSKAPVKKTPVKVETTEKAKTVAEAKENISGNVEKTSSEKESESVAQVSETKKGSLPARRRTTKKPSAEKTSVEEPENKQSKTVEAKVETKDSKPASSSVRKTRGRRTTKQTTEKESAVKKAPEQQTADKKTPEKPVENESAKAETRETEIKSETQKAPAKKTTASRGRTRRAKVEEKTIKTENVASGEISAPAGVSSEIKENESVASIESAKPGISDNISSEVKKETTEVKSQSEQSEKVQTPPESVGNKEQRRPLQTNAPLNNEIKKQNDNRSKRTAVEQGELVAGTLEIMPDGYGFLRKDNYLQGSKDIYVPPQYIRRFNLRTGDYVTGPGKLQRESDRYQALLYIKEVNGMPPEKMIRRPKFDRLTPIYPDDRFRLETARNELSTRIIDLSAPIGKGQRGMIVSPPKAGKTILLQKIANAISINNPDVKLIVLLIDERPEEVTDMQRSIKGEVVYSTFDKTPENHVKVTELVLERAMRLVELKQDVVILLDSMTRLARAYNLTINPTGRTLSGGLDPGALYGPKRFFGAARNIENGGSLTIIATSLIETGSRMDEVIFEEFKGTGNMEVYLDRKLSEKRIFPAIDINRSGTRREELLMTEKELDAVWTIRKAFSQLDTAAVTETIINLLLKTQNNEHFTSSVNVSFNDKSVFEAMRGTRPNGQANGNNSSNGNNNGNNR